MTANLTGTSTLDFVLNQKSSFNIVIKQWQDALKTIPINFPTGTWKLVVYNQVDSSVVMQLLQGSGLDITTNVLTIMRNNLQNNLPNGTYNYELRCDFADNTNILPFEGKIKIEKRQT